MVRDRCNHGLHVLSRADLEVRVDLFDPGVVDEGVGVGVDLVAEENSDDTVDLAGLVLGYFEEDDGGFVDEGVDDEGHDHYDKDTHCSEHELAFVFADVSIDSC